MFTNRKTFMLKHLIIGILCFTPLIGGEKEKLGERFQALSQAINQGNTEAISAYWADDATFTTPLVVLKGKEEVSKFVQERAKEIAQRKLHFSFIPGDVAFPASDKAVVNGIAEITNDKGALLQRNARRIELVQKNGEWLISSVKEIEVAPAPTTSAHLKDLEWLIGNWKDVDEDVNITFATKWDQFKNFIYQHFKMEVYGTLVMDGVQIIGWDPIEKKIRSWVYDSDGGVGTGLWTKSGDSWSAKLDYVLSDGSKGTATNIYTKVDDKSYKFSSIDRKIGNEAVPSIEPVTVTKVNNE